jgi:hypothetical protein
MLGEPTCGSRGRIAAINLRRPAMRAKQSDPVASEQGCSLRGPISSDLFNLGRRERVDPFYRGKTLGHSMNVRPRVRQYGG